MSEPAARVRILFLDVDGTLTDGIIGFTADSDLRHFWIRDGLALEWARDLGVLPIVISGRPSLALIARSLIPKSFAACRARSCDMGGSAAPIVVCTVLISRHG